jgi:hypothetical protein
MAYTSLRICSNNEIESNFYIFEIKIYTNNDLQSQDIMTVRKISYKNEGILLDMSDLQSKDNDSFHKSTQNIFFDPSDIKKIKITMCRINNINNIITIRKNFTSIIKKPVVLCRNNLVITLDNIDNNLSIRYMVI